MATEDPRPADGLDQRDRELLATMTAFEMAYYKQAMAAGFTDEQAWDLLLSKGGRF